MIEEVVRVMNITNGNEVEVLFESAEEAQEWIESQDFPEMYRILPD